MRSALLLVLSLLLLAGCGSSSAGTAPEGGADGPVEAAVDGGGHPTRDASVDHATADARRKTDAAPPGDGGLLPLCPPDASAPTGAGSLFVSPTGEDTNPGTLAEPFATVQRCASVAGPGSTCYLRAGTYRETVVPPASGADGGPITFEAYPCELAVVSGAEPVAGWTVSSGDVYVAPLTTALTEDGDETPRTQLFVDGQPGTVARWPNVTTSAFLDGDDDGTAGAGTAGTTLVDPALASFKDGAWNGALVHVRGGYAWTSIVGTVTSQTGDTLTLDIPAPEDLSAEPGSRYYLANVLSALDAPGEWYADGSHVYAWMPASDAPGGHVVEAKQRDLAFDLSGRSNIVVRGLELFAATVRTDDATRNVTIDSIVAAYLSHFLEEDDGQYYTAHAGDSGIQWNGTGNTLENSEIYGSTNDGVVVTGSGNTVTNCLIHDIDSMAVYSDPIFLVGDGHAITHNTIFQSGRDGLYVNGGSTGAAKNNEIAYNDIHDYGALNQDLGGVYGFGIDWSGTVVHHNWIHDLIPTTDRGFTGAAVGSGLYFDNGSVNITAHHNVTWQTYNGIQLNGIQPPGGGASTAPSMFIYNDTVGPNTGTGSASVASYPSPIDATGSKIENDIFAGGAFFDPANFHGEALSTNVLPGTDAGFVNASGDDLQLAAGSPAIGAGVVIAGVTTTTPPDIGAYEGGPFTPGCNLPGCK